jgi:hypothetical protein
MSAPASAPTSAPASTSVDERENRLIALRNLLAFNQKSSDDMLSIGTFGRFFPNALCRIVHSEEMLRLIDTPLRESDTEMFAFARKVFSNAGHACTHGTFLRMCDLNDAHTRVDIAQIATTYLRILDHPTCRTMLRDCLTCCIQAFSSNGCMTACRRGMCELTKCAVRSAAYGAASASSASAPSASAPSASAPYGPDQLAHLDKMLALHNLMAKWFDTLYANNIRMQILTNLLHNSLREFFMNVIDGYEPRNFDDDTNVFRVMTLPEKPERWKVVL